MQMTKIQVCILLTVFFVMIDGAIIDKTTTTNTARSTARNVPTPRAVYFSGYKWAVKASYNKTTPHENYFNNTDKNVFVDPDGYLHMKIIKQDDKWVSSGLYNYFKPSEYGSFVYAIGKGYELIDQRAVVGLFIYKNDTNQIDVQLSRWNRPKINNTQYVAQPASYPGNQNRFNMSGEYSQVVHSFTWTQDYILFQTFNAKSYDQVKKLVGKQDTGSSLLVKQWKYTGPNIPVKTNITICLNFWLYQMENGLEAAEKAPFNGLEQEVIIKEFKYIQL